MKPAAYAIAPENTITPPVNNSAPNTRPPIDFKIWPSLGNNFVAAIRPTVAITPAVTANKALIISSICVCSRTRAANIIPAAKATIDTEAKTARISIIFPAL